MNLPSSQGTLDWVRKGTALSALFPRQLPPSTPRRLGRLLAEGALSAAVALLLASRAEAAMSGVLVVFFSAAGLLHRFDGLLEENRSAIWGGDGRGANVRTATSLLALFLGVFGVYAAAVTLLPEAHSGGSLAQVAQVTALGSDTLLTRRFGSFLGLLSHNAGVLLSFCLMSLIYRSLGALLSLTWNAALWAAVLGVLVARAAGATTMSRGVFVTAAWLAVLPHLLLEASAYVTASLGSIFLSRGMTLYGLGDPRLRAVASAAARMLLAALALLAAAALTEATLPRLLQTRLAAEPAQR